LPEVFIYEEDYITVYNSSLNIVLNTAPNLTGIDQEVEVTQATTAITVTE